MLVRWCRSRSKANARIHISGLNGDGCSAERRPRRGKFEMMASVPIKSAETGAIGEDPNSRLWQLGVRGRLRARDHSEDGQFGLIADGGFSIPAGEVEPFCIVGRP